jgi:phosphonate transport system substrate-binding protein
LARSESRRLIAPLKFASCMAENSETFCYELVAYVHAECGIPMHYVTGIPWQEREQLFDDGEIKILWLCGLPYVHKAGGRKIELLAVPVPVGSRYGSMPIYFSDVVVNRDSPFKAFEDLRGSRWAYNEPLSHSGFNIVRAFLAGLGEIKGFFREVVESGAHTLSLELILNNRVDVAAIDSTVLEWIISQRPDVATRIRVVGSLGPSPIPPWVVSTDIPAHLRATLRQTFLGMHNTAAGRAFCAAPALAVSSLPAIRITTLFGA